MRILIITQDDPFYLAENFQFLLDNLPNGSEVVGAIRLKVSPFGKRLPLLDQALRTYKTFGARFFFYYSLRFGAAKLGFTKRVDSVLRNFEVPLIDVDHPVNHSSSLEAIRGLRPDLIISIAANQVFKQPLIDLAPKGCLNLHTSLLPKYRGLMPTFWVLANNEDETGVSVFFVDEEIDNGPIIVQKRVSIGSSTQAALIKKTKAIGMECIVEAIERIQNDDVNLIPNPKSEATYFSEPTREDVERFYSAGKRFF
ncbi:MAG: formyltransferase family protein [Pseudomonadota bacterium]